MRALVMDFPGDKRAWDIGDEYMFGPAFLAAPVTAYKARTRQVYLPSGTRWYDFYSGRSLAGGQTIAAAAPYERMPLFVRAGSIVPTGPAIQFTGNDSHSPLTLNVYTGANGSYSLYEDDGVSRQYLHGKWSRIPVRWNEATRTLTIGRREGSFSGMAGTRTINIRWLRPRIAQALDLDGKADVTISYDGRPKAVRMR
jgi:alpha-D-xyloside xylohydrolase